MIFYKFYKKFRKIKITKFRFYSRNSTAKIRKESPPPQGPMLSSRPCGGSEAVELCSCSGLLAANQAAAEQSGFSVNINFDINLSNRPPGHLSETCHCVILNRHNMKLLIDHYLCGVKLKISSLVVIVKHFWTDIFLKNI